MTHAYQAAREAKMVADPRRQVRFLSTQLQLIFIWSRLHGRKSLQHFSCSIKYKLWYLSPKFLNLFFDLLVIPFRWLPLEFTFSPFLCHNPFPPIFIIMFMAHRLLALLFEPLTPSFVLLESPLLFLFSLFPPFPSVVAALLLCPSLYISHCTPHMFWFLFMWRFEGFPVAVSQSLSTFRKSSQVNVASFSWSWLNFRSCSNVYVFLAGLVSQSSSPGIIAISLTRDNCQTSVIIRSK